MFIDDTSVVNCTRVGDAGSGVVVDLSATIIDNTAQVIVGDGTQVGDGTVGVDGTRVCDGTT